MAGVGIRYAEMARCLSAEGFEVTVIAPGIEDKVLSLAPSGQELVYSGEILKNIDRSYDAVVVQGHLAREVLPALRSTPVAVDLYDPFLLENMSYTAVLGKGVYQTDLALLLDLCHRGDFFLCASEQQRSYYLGILTSLDRVNPERLASDPGGRGLIDVVPFGVPDSLPVHRPYLPAAVGTRRLLFGGLYDWYDPWPLLEALQSPRLEDCRLFFVYNPNPESTPQQAMERIKAWCRERAWTAGRVEFLDWVPWERRFDLLRDVDLLVAPHRDTLETRFSMRTRFLEAIAVGCPVITTRGGTVSELVLKYQCGAIVAPGDPTSLAREIERLLASLSNDEHGVELRMQFLEEFSWRRALEPLIRFCHNPSVDRSRPPEVRRPRPAPSVAGARGRNGTSFSVLIPTFNRLDALPEVIEGLRGQYDPPLMELIVVNDGSTDETAEWLRAQRFPFPFKLIEQENAGPAAARNRAIETATGDYVALLGDDIVPDRYWLSSHAERHARYGNDPGTAVIGHTDWHRDVRRTRFRDFIDVTGWQFGYDQIDDPEDVPFNFLYSSNMSMRRERLLENLFNTNFPYPAWEDIELGYRLKNQGQRFTYEPGARAMHLHQPSIRRMAARHRKTGYVAVEFCRLHPDLEPFLWPSADSLRAASGPVLRTLRKSLAAALERLPLDIPGIWNSVLRDYYVAGIRDYGRNHGLGDVPDPRTWRVYPITFDALSPWIGHESGSHGNGSWICVPGKDKPGHGMFGPGFTIHEDQDLEARFIIRCDSAERGQKPLVTMDVYDQDTKNILTLAPIETASGADCGMCVTLPFAAKAKQRLEFRVFWHGTSRLEIFRVELDRARGTAE
jgi:glycosyltransferase involved in cell wall biosynthesis